MKVSYDINDDVSSQPFPSVRGEREVEVPILSYSIEKMEDKDDPIGITSKKHLGDFITKFGLRRHFEPFPRGWGLIEEDAREMPGTYVYANQIDDGRYSAISFRALVGAIQILYDGSKSYYGQELTLWSPNRPIDDTDAPGSGPWVLESQQVPVDWIEHRAFGSKEKFDEMVEQAEDGRHDVIELAREEIDGVLVLIAPAFPDPDDVAKIESDDDVNIDELIGEYKEKTGDTKLQDEDALDKFLEARDAI